MKGSERRSQVLWLLDVYKESLEIFTSVCGGHLTLNKISNYASSPLKQYHCHLFYKQHYSGSLSW